MIRITQETLTWYQTHNMENSLVWYTQTQKYGYTRDTQRGKRRMKMDRVGTIRIIVLCNMFNCGHVVWPINVNILGKGAALGSIIRLSMQRNPLSLSYIVRVQYCTNSGLSRFFQLGASTVFSYVFIPKKVILLKVLTKSEFYRSKREFMSSLLRCLIWW